MRWNKNNNNQLVLFAKEIDWAEHNSHSPGILIETSFAANEKSCFCRHHSAGRTLTSNIHDCCSLHDAMHTVYSLILTLKTMVCYRLSLRGRDSVGWWRRRVLYWRESFVRLRRGGVSEGSQQATPGLHWPQSAGFRSSSSTCTNGPSELEAISWKCVKKQMKSNQVVAGTDTKMTLWPKLLRESATGYGHRSFYGE